MSTWATPDDLARTYKISAETVRVKVRSGEWPASRFGRLIRFSPEHQAEIEEMARPSTVNRRNRRRVADILDSRAA